MVDFSRNALMDAYQAQTQLNQQQDAGQLTKLSQLLGLQEGGLKMQMLQSQIDKKKRLDALMADGGDGYSPAVSPALGLTPSAQPATQVQPVSYADKMMDAAKKAGDYEAFQEALKLKLEEKKLAPKFANEPRVVKGADGNPVLVQMADDGTVRPIQGGYGVASKLHFTDNGQQAGIGLDEYSGKAVSGGVQKVQDPNSIASNNLGYARLKQEQSHFNNPSLQHIETSDGIVAFNPKSGTAVPVVGPNGAQLEGGKGLTEVQAKGVGFATRSRQASDIIKKIGQGGEVQPGTIKRIVEAVPFAGEGLGTMTNWTQSPEQQQVEQAQRNFVNAVLRQESGAAISASEFENAKKQYFPQPGDSAKVIAQKEKNREASILALETQAGPGLKKAKSIFNGGAKDDATDGDFKIVGVRDK